MTGADVGTVAARVASRLSSTIVGRIPTTSRQVFLTIDDGPSGATATMLELLDRYQVGSTWFLVGKTAVAHRTVVADITAAGHSVGNHSFRHLDAWQTSWNKIREDLESGLTAVEDVAGERCLWTRPPFGRIRPGFLAWCRSHDQTPLLWDVMAPDFGDNLNPAATAETVRSKVREGSIVVMHDHGHPVQTEAFESTISALVGDGWRVTGLPVTS